MRVLPKKAMGVFIPKMEAMHAPSPAAAETDETGRVTSRTRSFARAKGGECTTPRSVVAKHLERESTPLVDATPSTPERCRAAAVLRRPARARSVRVRPCRRGRATRSTTTWRQMSRCPCRVAEGWCRCVQLFRACFRLHHDW